MNRHQAENEHERAPRDGLGAAGAGRGTMPVWLIAIGDELLEGRTADTHSQRVQRALGTHAVAVRNVQVVHDDIDAVVRALDRTGVDGLVFVYGGLGSTPDDLTREAVAAWAEVPLDEDPELRKRQEARWRRRGIEPRAGTERQAQVPAGLVPIDNPVGSAPALVGRLRGRGLVVLPGVPAELEALLPAVLEQLRATNLLPAPRANLLFRTAQRSELAITELSAPLRREFAGLQWSWWLVPWGVDLRVAVTPDTPATVAAELPRLEAALAERLGAAVYAREDVGLNEVVQEMMLARGASLAVAESCTAGLLGARLTDQAGSSAFFRGGILAYADAVKVQQLGVPAAMLREYGAVSRPTAEAMATGCRERFGTDHALAITGIAGPDGGTDDKPVGTTWLAVATPTVTHARCYRFPGTRVHNRRLAVACALDTLRRILAWGDERSPWLNADSWSKPVTESDPGPAKQTKRSDLNDAS